MLTASSTAATSWSEAVVAWAIANLIAVIALIQPYFYWAWKRYFRKGRIDVHETAKVEVGYSGLGTTIALFGTLRAIYEDQFVRSVDLELTRVDNLQRRFEWLALRPATVVIGGAQTTVEIVSGFMLLTSQPKKYNIIFVDPDFQARVTSVIERVRNRWSEFLRQQVILGAAFPFSEEHRNDLFEQFSQTPDHVAAYMELDRMFDWQPVEYSIQFRVNTAHPNKKFERELRFALTPQDIENLRLNALTVIREACGRPLVAQYNFAYCSYITASLPTQTRAASA